MEQLAQQYIDSTNVTPHWLPDGDAFWYKHNTSPDKYQFFLVNALEKSRELAFDHKGLAESLQEKTQEEVDQFSLPFNWIEPDPQESCVRFRWNDRKWRFDPENKLQEWDGKFTTEPNHLLQKEVISAHSDTRVTVDFVNRTGKTLRVFWIDWSAKAIPYMSIKNGETKRQITYVGHVWRLVDVSDEKNRAVYSAPDEGNHVAIIDHLSNTIPEASPPSNYGDSESDEESTEPEKGPCLYVKDFNAWFKNKVNEEYQLSENGTTENPYDKRHAYIAPDEQFAVAWQFTPAQDHKISLVESSPEDQIEPKLHTRTYLKPGDRVRIDRPRLFDLKAHREVTTNDFLFKNPYQLSNLGWNYDSQEYLFYYNERGHQHTRVIGIKVDGSVRALVEEESRTFVDYTKSYFKVRRDSDELIWASERDGSNHLYLIDLVTGSVKNQITKGQWMVHLVESVDKELRKIWVRGYGLKSGEDPYHAHLASVNFDGSDFKVLTDGDGTHSWSFSPDKRYMIDTWSRVDCPPTTVLRDGQSGEMIMTLEKTDLKELEDKGWSSPERFVTPGRDGKTLIYGIIIRPTDFNSSRKYPVLDDIYAGPHEFRVPKAFSTLSDRRQWADEGYIVVVVDGMGTNWRSKTFHDICHKNLHDSGLPDHIAWLKAAASTRPWMDLSRVGIMGVSAGGQNAVAGMLHNGDIFKAGIADSGCHDNRMDKLWWNELWMGYPVDEAYEKVSNITHAEKLKGPLMLIVGDMDDNVDPSSTFQMANALNKAGKNYEFLFIPGGRHGCGGGKYGLARQREFFKRHLQEESKYLVDMNHYSPLPSHLFRSVFFFSFAVPLLPLFFIASTLKMKISYFSVGLLALFSPLAAAWSKEDREIFRIRDEISKYETDPAATFYDILGVPPSASLDDITKAYRKQTRNLHPDKVRQAMRSKAGKDKKTGAKTKPPTNAEIKAAVKKAGEAQARLSLIANILRGPERDRYDHFLSNGFPLWKGTDYYYNRYRPGLGTVIVGLFLVVGGGIHYLTLYMSWKRQKEFVERYIKFARDTAWGGGLNIPGVDAAPAPAPAASPAPASDEEEAPPLPQNRRERRMQEKAAKRDGARPAKKTRRAPASSGTATPTPAAGPTGARKRVVAENGKILVVDSLGDVYLEGEDDEGEVHEFLLDPNELAKPTIKDTAVFRAPIFLFNITAGRFLSKKPTNLEIEIPAEDEDSDVPQPTPSTDSAGEDFELLDKSTDSLSKAKASGASQGKANKRKGKKR
ncbi:prolyl tripeptidyl peptidase [Fusarium beomiforme]|uniref:Probable dipeptidyl-aminopeptidase B n=1 Tax=Fusarium beomiforme TaxID=44412 RepID=A0A9P5DV35_9HYPO|nr:prolyl tripeptidyl peptidase [Fusarium beomiforme]